MLESNKISSFVEYEQKMKDFEAHIKMMIGKMGQPIPLHVMIVSGEKGVGKTYTAEKILEENKSIRKYYIIKSSISAVQLYQSLWHHNDAIIVLDDVNSILTDNKDGASLLKACTDSYPKRKLNWEKQNSSCINISNFDLDTNEAIKQKMDELIAIKQAANPKSKFDPLKAYPSQFYFTGALIILTNKPLSVFDKASEGAVSNRGWHQEMLFSAKGAVDMLIHKSEIINEFNGISLSNEDKSAALSFLTSGSAMSFYTKNGRIPTLRTFGKIALEHQFGHELTDETLANNTESPAY